MTIEYVRRTQTKALQRLRSADTYRILEAFVHGQVRAFVDVGVVYMYMFCGASRDGGELNTPRPRSENHHTTTSC